MRLAQLWLFYYVTYVAHPLQSFAHDELVDLSTAHIYSFSEGDLDLALLAQVQRNNFFRDTVHLARATEFDLHDDEARKRAGSRTFPVEYEEVRLIRGEQRIQMPPQRLCPKGSYDSDVGACVWLDKRDRVLPNYECPPGSVLDGDFCYGRIVADYEFDCPRGFLINEDEICVKALVYTPPRNMCPQGFALISAAPEGRQKICKRVKYAAPLRRPVESIPRVEMEECSSEKKDCPKPEKPAADREWVLQCPSGTKLVRSKDGISKACKVEILVPPMPTESCGPGFRLVELVNFGIGCVRLAAQDPALVCPGPRPKFGPGFGTWDTPRYKYDPLDKCVTYRAKALEGQCPFGYEWQQDTCYRKHFMPYYMDCNNLEGYGFVWDPEQQQGICEYLFDPFKWTPGTSYLTRRERLNAGRIYLLSNPFDVKRAYEHSNDAAQALRPPSSTQPATNELSPARSK